MRHEESLGLHVGHDHVADHEAVEPEVFFGDSPALHHLCLGIEHVEHVRRFDPGALAHFEVVEIMPRSDLHRAAAQFRIGVFVVDDPEPPPGERLENFLADNAGIARIIRVHRDGHVGQHRLGPGGRHHYMVRAVRQLHPIRQRITEVPEAALDLAGFNLEVADRGLELGVPVDQPLVAVNQPLIVEVDEDLHHCLGEMRVHGELLARPVHRTAQPPELLGDRAAALGLPFPHLFDKGLAGVIGALVLALFHLPLDHHLRGDAGVIGAHHPQCILATHALVAHDDILQGIVERVADMQASGDIGRRVDDGEGHGIGALGPEQAIALPVLIPLRLNRGGVESLV